MGEGLGMPLHGNAALEWCAWSRQLAGSSQPHSCHTPPFHLRQYLVMTDGWTITASH